MHVQICVHVSVGIEILPLEAAGNQLALVTTPCALDVKEAVCAWVRGALRGRSCALRIENHLCVRIESHLCVKGESSCAWGEKLSLLHVGEGNSGYREWSPCSNENKMLSALWRGIRKTLVATDANQRRNNSGYSREEKNCVPGEKPNCLWRKIDRLLRRDIHVFWVSTTTYLQCCVLFFLWLVRLPKIHFSIVVWWHFMAIRPWQSNASVTLGCKTILFVCLSKDRPQGLQTVIPFGWKLVCTLKSGYATAFGFLIIVSCYNMVSSLLFASIRDDKNSHCISLLKLVKEQCNFVIIVFLITLSPVSFRRQSYPCLLASRHACVH